MTVAVEVVVEEGEEGHPEKMWGDLKGEEGERVEEQV